MLTFAIKVYETMLHSWPHIQTLLLGSAVIMLLRYCMSLPPCEMLRHFVLQTT